MKFYIRDKNNYELNIIIDILTDNHIKHKVITNHIPCLIEDESKDEDDWEEAYYITYDICLDTSLEIFDYMKYLINTRMLIVDKLNQCLKKKVRNKKNEINISK